MREKTIDKKTGRTVIETNAEKLNDLMVEECVIYPNLNDAQLQDSYGAVGAGDLVKKMLIPGEYTDLVFAINESNGFDSGMVEKIKRAKN